MDIWKSTLGRGKGKCKGPEVRTCLAIWIIWGSSRKASVAGARCVRGKKKQEVRPGCVGPLGKRWLLSGLRLPLRVVFLSGVAWETTMVSVMVSEKTFWGKVAAAFDHRTKVKSKKYLAGQAGRE